MEGGGVGRGDTWVPSCARTALGIVTTETSPQQWGAIWAASHSLWSAFNTRDSAQLMEGQKGTGSVKHPGQCWWVLLRKIALFLSVFLFLISKGKTTQCEFFQIITSSMFCVYFFLLFRKYKLNLRNVQVFAVSYRPFQRKENPSSWRGRWWKLLGPSSPMAWAAVSLLRDLQKTNPRRVRRAELQLRATGNSPTFI